MLALLDITLKMSKNVPQRRTLTQPRLPENWCLTKVEFYRIFTI